MPMLRIIQMTNLPLPPPDEEYKRDMRRANLFLRIAVLILMVVFLALVAGLTYQYNSTYYWVASSVAFVTFCFIVYLLDKLL